MSTPIKPPGGPAAPGASDAPGAVDKASPSQPFRETLDAAQVDGAHEVQGVELDGDVARIAQDLQAGRVDAASAVNQLVARALESASALPPARRVELEAFLRDLIEADPLLLSLTEELERVG